MSDAQKHSDALPSAWRALLAPALLVGGLGLLYWLLAPAVPDGDGIGYLRQVHWTTLAPGHLGYLPLLRWLARVAPHAAPLDLVPSFRALSILCAVAALAFFYDAARLVHGVRPALFATALLGVCHAFARSASEIETYAIATLFVVATLWALVHVARASTPARGDAWAAAAGLTCGAAVLFHLTLALLAVGLVPLIARWSPAGRRARRALLTTAAGALVVVIPLLVALRSVGHTTLSAAWTWLRSADHGLPYPHSWRTPLVVVWGFIRSLIYAPYPYDAPLTRVVLLTGAGVVGWAVLLWLRRRTSASPRLSDGVFLALWASPLVLFAATFFPSDTERWIFVVPAVSLCLAPVAGRSAAVVLLLVALLNGAVYQLPTAVDRAPLRRAAAVDAHLRARDLLVYPGHSWDELVGMGVPRPSERFCFIYHVGAERSLERAVARTHRAIGHTFARGGRVFVARLHDDRDDQGFKEMGWFGLSRPGFAAIFAPYSPRATGVPDLWALSPPVTSTAGRSPSSRQP